MEKRRRRSLAERAARGELDAPAPRVAPDPAGAPGEAQMLRETRLEDRDGASTYGVRSLRIRIGSDGSVDVWLSGTPPHDLPTRKSTT